LGSRWLWTFRLCIAGIHLKAETHQRGYCCYTYYKEEIRVIWIWMPTSACLQLHFTLHQRTDINVHKLKDVCHQDSGILKYHKYRPKRASIYLIDERRVLWKGLNWYQRTWGKELRKSRNSCYILRGPQNGQIYVTQNI
jgi:hypothetical protein